MPSTSSLTEEETRFAMFRHPEQWTGWNLTVAAHKLFGIQRKHFESDDELRERCRLNLRGNSVPTMGPITVTSAERAHGELRASVRELLSELHGDWRDA